MIYRYSDGFGRCDLCGETSPPLPAMEKHHQLCIEVRALREAVAELRARIDSELGRETVPATVEDQPCK